MERPLDDGAGEWFASIGGKDPDRAEPAWYFEKVPERKDREEPLHVDVFDPSPGAVDQLVELGQLDSSDHPAVSTTPRSRRGSQGTGG
jgi:hypothetical protein